MSLAAETRARENFTTDFRRALLAIAFIEWSLPVNTLAGMV